MNNKPTEKDLIVKNDHRLPVLIIAIGRQRVGKTVFLNSLYQIFKEQGADMELWNGDAQNVSLSLSNFHKDIYTYQEENNIGIQKSWIEGCIDRMVNKTRKDALLDVGGGNTGLNLLINELDFIEYTKEMGIQLTVAYMIGPDVADIDFLKKLYDLGTVLPSSTMIIFNEALISEYVSLMKYFTKTLENPTINSILMQDGRAAIMPKLIDIEYINERCQLFRDFANSKQVDGFPVTSSIFAFRTKKWLEEKMIDFFNEFPQEWLPRLPNNAKLIKKWSSHQIGNKLS